MSLSHGELTYNGYTFGPHSHVQVQTDFVYDEAGRTVIGHRHTITVDAIVTPQQGDDSTDGHMDDIREKLAEPGQSLYLQDKGFGSNLWVNTNSGTQDIEFGPKPQMISWLPIGHDQAAEVKWQVTTTVAPCDGNSGTGLAAFNYEVGFAINERGATTRTVTGHILIAMTRDGRDIPDTADAYRDLIDVRKPAHFQRISQDFRLSTDKRKLNFTITDKELGSRNAWPEGVVDIQANHQVTQNLPGPKMPNVISAVIALAHDQPASRAYEIFTAIVNQRLAYSESSGSDTEPKRHLITSVEVREDIYGNQFGFRITYELLGSIGTFLGISGIFTPMPDDWEDWADSMAAVTPLRGKQGFSHTKSQDRITDLCDTDTTDTGSGDGPTTVPPITSFSIACNPKPSPELSWLRFEAVLSEETNYESTSLATLGDVVVENQPFDPDDVTASLNDIDVSDIETIVANGSPHMRFVWSGYAERAGYKVPEPGILKVGDVELIPTEQRMFARKRLGTMLCQPIHAAVWKIVYAVKTRPATGDTDLQDENPADPETLSMADPASSDPGSIGP